MRRKPTIIAFKTPSQDSLELAKRQEETPEEQEQRRAEEGRARTVELPNGAELRYPVGKPLEVRRSADRAYSRDIAWMVLEVLTVNRRGGKYWILHLIFIDKEEKCQWFVGLTSILIRHRAGKAFLTLYCSQSPVSTSPCSANNYVLWHSASECPLNIVQLGNSTISPFPSSSL